MFFLVRRKQGAAAENNKALAGCWRAEPPPQTLGSPRALGLAGAGDAHAAAATARVALCTPRLKSAEAGACVCVHLPLGRYLSTGI